MKFNQLQTISEDSVIEVTEAEQIRSYLNSQQVTSWENNSEYLHPSWVRLATFSPNKRINGHGNLTVLVCQKQAIESKGATESE